MAENEKDISVFLRNNKNLLRRIRKDLYNLNSKDQKLLVESLLNGKVTVNYDEDSEEYGPGGPVCEYKCKGNLDILKRFAEEGKITKLDQNSTHSFRIPE